jgi:DNA-binding IclR family transcriptional regulator
VASRAKTGREKGTRTSSTADSGSVAERLLRMLSVVAEADGDFGIKDVADRLGLAPSTVHRMLHVLQRNGFVDRTAQRRYHIGMEFYRIAALAVDSQPLTELARPFMARVVSETGETCLFGAYHAHDQTLSFVAKVDSPQPLRYRVIMHQPFHIVWGASGRSVLAFLDDATIEEIARHDYFSPNDGRMLDKTELRAAIARIRKRHYAVTRGHAWAGSVGIGTPVFGPGGRIVGTLSVTIPEFRFASRDEAKVAKVLLQQAKLLSRALGARPGATALPKSMKRQREAKADAKP